MKIRLVFYKGMKTWTDWIIAGWTFPYNIGTPPYSHVEIGFLFGDGWRYFSSSIRDGGTRWKCNITKNHPERWDIYECEYDDKFVNGMLKRANDLNGKKYDWLGILGFATITGIFANKSDWWYCSEATWKVLTGTWKKRISPRRLYTRIKNDFKLVKPRKEK